MTQTMRERLIEAAARADINPTGERDMDSRLGHHAATEVVDAILAELRQPDEVMWAAGADRDALGWDADPGTVFTAMIDAIRTGDET